MRETLQALVDHAGTGFVGALAADGPGRRRDEGPLGRSSSCRSPRTTGCSTASRSTSTRPRPRPSWAGSPRYSNASMLIESYEWFLAHRAELAERKGSHHQSPVKLGVLALLKRLPVMTEAHPTPAPSEAPRTTGLVRPARCARAAARRRAGRVRARRDPADRRRRGPALAPLVPDRRPRPDRAAGPRRRHRRLADDRAGRPPRHPHRPGQPPRPAQLLAPRPRLPAARHVGVRRSSSRPCSSTSWPSAWRSGWRSGEPGRGWRCGVGAAVVWLAAGLRPRGAHDAVEPVPARSPGGWCCSSRCGRCSATTRSCCRSRCWPGRSAPRPTSRTSASFGGLIVFTGVAHRGPHLAPASATIRRGRAAGPSRVVGPGLGGARRRALAAADHPGARPTTPATSR